MIHSKIFNTARNNYKKGLWSKAKLQALVFAGALTADEYEEITGEAYEA